MAIGSMRHQGDSLTLPRVDGLHAVTDDGLLELQGSAGATLRRVHAVVAAISGELARRSARSSGHDGLAARLGTASPEKAVQQLTGVSLPEARALVIVGTAVSDAPWLAPVGEAVSSGEMSVAAASGIAAGLGEPSDDVAADDLLDAATQLVGLAEGMSAEQTAKAARQARERLDVARIADIERHRRSRRSLIWRSLPTGNVRVTGEFDPESAAIVIGAVENVMSPRREPRFVDAEREFAADTADTADTADVADVAAADDGRTREQLAADALVEIVQLAVRAAGSAVDGSGTHGAAVFGSRSPGVRVHVQATDLQRGEGFCYIEGQAGFLSLDTAKRLACDAGWLPVLFDGDAAIDVGRTQRLHTPKQRVAIAAQ